MKELFDQLPVVEMGDVLLKENSILLDTCFLINALENHHEDHLQELMYDRHVYMTSFNIEELNHVRHKIPHSVKDKVREFFKTHTEMGILTIPVSPGNKTAEMNYVKTVDGSILFKIPDPSDAVLIAAAIASHSDVLTKDRHHLFTTKLEHHLNKYGLRVLKEFHEV